MKVKELLLTGLLVLLCAMPNVAMAADTTVTRSYPFESATQENPHYTVPETVEEGGKTYTLTSVEYKMKAHREPVTVVRTIVTGDPGDYPKQITETVDGTSRTLTAQTPTWATGESRTVMQEYASESEVPQSLTVDGVRLPLASVTAGTFRFRCGDSHYRYKIYRDLGDLLVVRVSGVSSRFAQVAMTVKAGSASRSIYMDDRTMAHVERLEERSDAAYRIHAVEGTRSVQDRSVFTHAAFFPADAAVRQPERRESKYIPADMIELARSQDVFDILQRTGEPLFQKDGQWRSVEHDSLVVTPGKGYYWFSRAEGSKSPIDYFVNVHGMGFQEAVRTVLEAIHRDVTYTPPVWLPPAEHEEFRPLPRAKTNLDAYNYLVQERGLDQELVDGLMRQGRIYQSGKYKNVVFVGTDFDGVVASNFARSCDPTQQVQRFDVRGSQKEYRFRMENPDCPRCNVFESEIDLLSYLSMRPADQRTENYIALGGVSPRALLAFLQYRPDVSQINLCTDGDRAGEQCAESIRTLLEGQYEISREAAPIGKDWNESLVRIRELQESWEHETNDPETETWRDDLTSQEAQIVAAWDDGFDHGLARMVTLSRTQDDPGLRSAMAKLDPVEQVRSPFARKAEDWTY